MIHTVSLIHSLMTVYGSPAWLNSTSAAVMGDQSHPL